MLNQSEDTLQSQLFTEDELKEALQQGYFECVGSSLLYKQPGIDGYHNNMADLRDFIEQWMSKLETTINNRIIEPVLKHFNPKEYGTLFEIDTELSKRIQKTQKSIESLNRLYRYIFHRRVLEGKEKQRNLGSNRLNMRDVADINMIERRCTQIESTIRFLKYMKWFVDTSFFARYQTVQPHLEQKHKERQSEKRLHYKNNLLQFIKNLVLVDNLFIDKIFEESNVKGSSPKVDYKFLLKNSKFSNFSYPMQKENEEEAQNLTYPLKNMEEFLILLKATNVSKIKDYIMLYTLLDMQMDEDSEDFQNLIQELDLAETYKEIKFYWRLETSFLDKTHYEYIANDLKELESSNPQWATSILQTLLELKNYDLAMVYISARELNLKQQKSLELIVYAL